MSSAGVEQRALQNVGRGLRATGAAKRGTRGKRGGNRGKRDKHSNHDKHDACGDRSDHGDPELSVARQAVGDRQRGGIGIGCDLHLEPGQLGCGRERQQDPHGEGGSGCPG